MIPVNGFNITPSDTMTFNPPVNGVYVGTAGTVVVQFQNGGSASFKAPAGQYLVGRFSKVMVASTAADLVGLY